MLVMKLTRGRPKAFDEDEALALAMNYFWEHGYDNTSLDKLLPAMGIKKSSFYHTFKSKEELFSRALHLYRKETQREFISLREEVGAKNALIMIVSLTMQELRDTGKVKGCLLASSGQECYNKYPHLSEQVGQEFFYFLALFEETIQKAQESGEIKNTLSPRRLAGRYSSALNGLLVTIQAGAPQEVLDDLVESVKEILA
jgi:TetR/AcrR family transcriptional repressor of nem operon